MAILSTFAAGDVDAQRTRAEEYALKAAFVYNLARFVEWPGSRFADESSPVSFCVLGDDPFGELLETTLGGRTVAGRTIEFRRLALLDGARGCHIAFIAKSEDANVTRAVGTLRGNGVLTVGETDTFSAAGGIIRLSIPETQVRFAVNLRAAVTDGLKISSRVLSLALDVVR